MRDKEDDGGGGPDDDEKEADALGNELESVQSPTAPKLRRCAPIGAHTNCRDLLTWRPRAPGRSRPACRCGPRTHRWCPTAGWSCWASWSSRCCCTECGAATG